jgi:glyoxylase-like metal-dependent hydrolase (beta-lactamase superfamily II)
VSWTGGALEPWGQCVLAPNPGMMTLQGTNTWVLKAPGAEHAVVVDPGPIHEGHLRAVHEAAGSVELVLVTHRHHDHTEGLARFVELTRCPVRAVDPAYRVGFAGGLEDGDVIDAGGLRIEVVATPGHTDDSVSFLLPESGVLLSGDTVLGHGTTVVAHPDGALRPYLASLQRLLELVDSGAVRSIWPGHGPVVADPGAVLRHYLDHRQERLAQVRDAVAAGAVTAREVVERVYADVDRALWGAAEWSVEAQLAYLRES